MTAAVRRRAEWVFYALELGSSGVHTGIARLSRLGDGRTKHLD